MAIINFYKNQGETPLEAIRRFQLIDSRFLNSKITYAGRLDPIAEGVLILLTDEDVHKKDDFLKLPKEYEFEVLFGFKTDTGDILGKIVESPLGLAFVPKAKPRGEKILEIANKISPKLIEFLGKQNQKYPVYSSKTVDGKPLFSYAREDLEVEQPTKEIEIFSLDYLNSKTIRSKKLLSELLKRIGKVKGDFRQREILDFWTLALQGSSESFVISRFKVSASSGFYVRVLAEKIGEKIGQPSLAYRIKRTKVGEFMNEKS